MKKYLLNAFAILTAGLAMTSCMQEFDTEVQEQQISLNNAQQTLGFYIPENQDWVMTSTATATFNVKGLSDEATVYVFSNNPQADGYGSVLASGQTTGTTTTLSEFSIPAHLEKVFVGVKESNGNMVYKYVDVENGQITADYDFSSTASARTRASAVVDGDPFTFENTASYYKTIADIPNDAKDINTSSDYDCVMSGKLVATSGMRSNLNLWQGPAVDIYINGEVTIPTGAYIHSANIYVLPGSTLTVYKQANYGCKIYVSENAILNYYVSKLETNNDGTGRLSSIYNRGTVSFADNFEANQDVIIYNEGTMTGKDITSKPGDGHTSLFYNFGELTLTGNMVLNSCANFYNEGTVTVSGETNVTQKNIYWINKGHYTTGSMIFSAKNATFYNYCQLLVKGNAHMYDGEFNLMSGSYTEAATADFDNFIVNMGGNSGFNVLGNNTWAAQGDGTFQGFKATGTNNYVRLGGNTTVAGHLKSLETSGTITLAYNNIIDQGAGNSGVQPTYQFNEGTTKVKFSELNPTYNTTNCGASWNGEPSIDEPVTENQTWTYAFEDNKTRCDFDLNDVVIQVRESEANAKKLIVKLVAAGCEYDNYVWLGDTQLSWNGKAEVHEAFGATHGVMVNTGRGVDMDVVETTIDKPSGFDFQTANFKIRPFKVNSDPTVSTNAVNDYISVVTSSNSEGLGKAPLGIAIPAKWKWPKERVVVNNAYSGFTAWGKQSDLTLRAGQSGWYQNPVSGTVYGE
jgi:hypothetical protein